MDAGGLQPQGYNDVAEMELSRVHHGVSQLFFTVNHPFFTQKQVFYLTSARRTNWCGVWWRNCIAALRVSKVVNRTVEMINSVLWLAIILVHLLVIRTFQSKQIVFLSLSQCMLVLKLAPSHVQEVYLKMEHVTTNLNLTFERWTRYIYCWRLKYNLIGTPTDCKF